MHAAAIWRLPAGWVRAVVLRGVAVLAAVMVGCLAWLALWGAPGDYPAGAAAPTGAHARVGLAGLPVAFQAVASSSVGAGSRRFEVARVAGRGLVASGGGLSTVFGRSGPVVGAGGSTLALGLMGVGRGGRLSTPSAASPVAAANRVSYRRGAVVEWYRNGPLGLEQGFTVARRLAGSGGPLRLSLAVGGGLRPVLARGGGGLVFQRAGGAAVLRYRGLVATDARGDWLPAWFSLRAGRVEIRVADRGARYPLRIDPFVQQAKLVGTGAVGNAWQGWSVALSADGSTALIGGPNDNQETGAAWVFTRSGATWSQQAKVVGTGAVSSFPEQGSAVALSDDGNTALVGAPFDGDGAARVFTRSGSTWSQQARLVGAGVAVGNDGVRQGSSVALSGDGNTALSGGPNDNNNTGAAWAFSRSGSTWSQQGSKLVGTGSVGNVVEQGSSVALSDDGNTALSGGPNDNSDTGAAWAFTRSGSTWSQQGSKLVGTGALGQAEQGRSIALSADGNTAVSGGPHDNNNTGAAWAFIRSGSAWSQQGAKLVGSGTVDESLVGESVALSGDGNTVLIGGMDDTRYTGAVWEFTRSASTWFQAGPKQVGSGAVGQPREGWSVALSADRSTALIGGPFDNSKAGAAWAFAVSPPPTISSFTPGSRITGSGVTITGTNLNGATGVKFGSLAASFTVVSDTQIHATVPNGAVAAPILVTTSGGTASSSTSFTPTLSITSLSPTCGPFGTVVALRGVGFTPGSTVNFNGTAATTVKYVSSGEVQATVPSTATSGPIALTNTSAPAGTVQARVNYTVTPHNAPTITSFTPGSGITGTKVTITGTFLCGASNIKFGSVAAPNFSVYSSTQLGVRVPNGAVAGPISLATAAGTATSSTNFTPTLSITSFSPASGPPRTVVDIHGIGFTPGSTVHFNGTAASSVTFISSSEVKATVPAGATTGPIMLTNTSSPVGTVGSAKNYSVT
jgi:hypothetical protein